jgi:hypothetical protein
MKSRHPGQMAEILTIIESQAIQLTLPAGRHPTLPANLRPFPRLPSLVRSGGKMVSLDKLVIVHLRIHNYAQL